MGESVVGILLAGGSGSRFRASGGGDKLLHPLADGTPIGVASMRNLLAAVPRVVAVIRPGAEALATALCCEGGDVTVCPDAEGGMGRTLAHAVVHAGAARCYVVALADMPFIRPETIRAVAERIESGALLATPVYQGARGHPVGFARSLQAELAALEGDTGARQVIDVRRTSVQQVEVADAFVLRDVDTVNDLLSAQPKAKTRTADR